MVYIALLRGVNVGGKSIVSMPALKSCLEQLGLDNVKTYINSGNVIFSSEETTDTLAARIEAALDQAFDPGIRVLIKPYKEFSWLADAIPTEWVNDTNMKCDIMFLWPDVDKPSILATLPSDPDIEDVRYLPGAVLWRIDRSLVSKSKMARIASAKIYKQMTVRNANTVRKLVTITDEAR